MSSHPLAFLRLPNSLLMALDSRAYHFWFQPVHYLARIVHILTMAAFFGLEFLFILAVIQNLDRPTVVRISRFMVKPLHISYALAMISGFALFFYDPVHIGNRAYLSPKLIALAVAGVLAWLGHKSIYWPVMAGRDNDLPKWTKAFCVASCVVWAAVIVFSCLNSEGVPKVYLRHYF
ncbi:hypothetical protein [Acetobacter oryzifermentans]|uniref:Uncharacterized protein n=1 Tax=Acetobacter oryzifermentans TaxID=1633874 RepID=A0ABM6ALQ7_9PROT|nr:hypothetical protein [Acetobacter oryzifermentans]ANA14696.1 hypothetical protein WG31_12500 [Acetobacter oryzifermentans]